MDMTQPQRTQPIKATRARPAPASTTVVLAGKIPAYRPAANTPAKLPNSNRPSLDGQVIDPLRFARVEADDTCVEKACL